MLQPSENVGFVCLNKLMFIQLDIPLTSIKYFKLELLYLQKSS